MIVRISAICLGIAGMHIADHHASEVKKEIEIFSPHEKQKRFKGTKIYLKSPTVSPDYEIIASVDHTENNGKDVFVTWMDAMGVVSPRYKLKPDDEIRLISIKDAEQIGIKPSDNIVINTIQRERKRARKININTILHMLKRSGIDAFIEDDRILFCDNAYYVTCDDEEIDLGSTRRGLIYRYKSEDNGMAHLRIRAKKLCNKFNYESIDY